MSVVVVCQEMGWTYLEYVEQPSWFLSMVMDKLQIDSRKAKQEIDRTRRGQRNTG